MNDRHHHESAVQGRQMSLFANTAENTENAGVSAQVVSSNVRVQPRQVVINAHLLAARRIARKMRRLPDRSAAETRAGLAICAQLKAYLADGEENRPDANSAQDPGFRH